MVGRSDLKGLPRPKWLCDDCRPWLGQYLHRTDEKPSCEGLEDHSSPAALAGEAWAALMSLSMDCTRGGTGIPPAGWDTPVPRQDAPPAGRAALNNPGRGPALVWRCLSICTSPRAVSLMRWSAPSDALLKPGGIIWERGGKWHLQERDGRPHCACMQMKWGSWRPRGCLLCKWFAVNGVLISVIMWQIVCLKLHTRVVYQRQQSLLLRLTLGVCLSTLLNCSKSSKPQPGLGCFWTERIFLPFKCLGIFTRHPSLVLKTHHCGVAYQRLTAVTR